MVLSPLGHLAPLINPLGDSLIDSQDLNFSHALGILNLISPKTVLRSLVCKLLQQVNVCHTESLLAQLVPPQLLDVCFQFLVPSFSSSLSIPPPCQADFLQWLHLSSLCEQLVQRISILHLELSSSPFQLLTPGQFYPLLHNYI